MSWSVPAAIRRRLQAATSRGLSRFVGRQTEVAALERALTAAGNGHGQVVALMGEPGVGKSRLVYEFVHSHGTRDWLILESTSVSYGKATPYFPVIDLLKSYCKIDSHDDPRTIRAKVTGQVLTLDDGFHDTIPALLMLLEALPGDNPFLILDPLQRRQRTLEALKRVLLRESQVQPLLLVFEDLHWIDSETQALLDTLVESLPTARLLFLVNYRPEYQHGWGSKTYYTQLRLDPLPPESAEELLQSLLGDDAGLESLKHRLIARTEGNPFFLEESMHTLVETGVLVGEPGAYRLAQALPTIQVPATVQAVLAARIDRLRSEEKRLLQTAAVIGTEVPLPLLQAITAPPDEALHRGLAHLQAAEFLYEMSLFPEREYTFKHALTHEVAYAGLLQERRRSLHARIVEAFEALYPDRLAEQVERLAHHAFRGEVWDKALTYFRQAGVKAGNHYAYREAARCFEQALQALQHLPESRDTLEQGIDLRISLRTTLLPLGEFRRIHDLLRDAATLAEALGDQRRLAQICDRLCLASWQAGDYGAALEFGQRALAIGMALGDVTRQLTAHVNLAHTYIARGEYGRAIRCLRTAVSLEGALRPTPFNPTGANDVNARARLSQCLAELGGFAEGITHGEIGIRMAEARDHPFSRASAYGSLGDLYLRQGELHKAVALLERGVELCQTWQIQFYFPHVALPLGAAYTLSGRVREALPLLEQAVEQAVSMGFMPYLSRGFAALSEGYLVAGRPDGAMPLARRALEVARQHQERGNEAWALRCIGEIAAHRDPPDVEQAAVNYRQALALAEERGMQPLVAHCHFGLGTLCAKTGPREQARAELSPAVEMYRAMEMTFWLPEAERALAEVEGH